MGLGNSLEGRQEKIVDALSGPAVVDLRPAGRVRLDSGVVDGSEVSIHYDPMLAKVISFAPTRTRAAESKSALRRVVKTFFEGSLADAVAALVDTADGKLPAEELKRIEAIIKKAKSK